MMGRVVVEKKRGRSGVLAFFSLPRVSGLQVAGKGVGVVGF
jgi:hypothetical protein